MMKRHFSAGRLLLAGFLSTAAGTAVAHPGHHEGIDPQVLVHWLSQPDHVAWIVLLLVPAIALLGWQAARRQDVLRRGGPAFAIEPTRRLEDPV